MKVFASEMLTMLPLLHAFIQDVVAPMDTLPDHARCFGLLVAIVEVLKQGPSAAARQHNELKQMIVQHHEIFIRVYGSNEVKPKWHHMIHLGDGGRSIMSCFVTERKHKSVKRAGTWCFNEYEKPVLRSLLAQQSAALGQKELYQTECIINASTINIDGLQIRRSTAAHLKCGEVRRGDVVVLTGCRVGEVVSFIMLDQLMVQMHVCSPTSDAKEWCRGLVHEFAHSADIMCPVPWADRGHGRIRIVPPLSWR
jgi:hypothetical protein